MVDPGLPPPNDDAPAATPPDDPLRRTLLEARPLQADAGFASVPLLAANAAARVPVQAGHARADVTDETVAYRPVLRPPMAVLQVADDGLKTAECVRIRAASFVIGRTEGDVVIPHDHQLSGRHAEIVRLEREGRFVWLLRDLNSTNGTFVRVREAALKDGTEFLIARRRFRFAEASPAAVGAAEARVPAMDITKTCDWRALHTARNALDRPSLVEMLHDGDGRRYPLAHDSYWIGRDAKRSLLALSEDRSVNSLHARVFRDPQGRWRLEDANSLNGVWVRVTEVSLASQGAFLLGEQLFVFVLP
jgi:pSer/pThr/pTyr-binding forkhead associated (FHA) protein